MDHVPVIDLAPARGGTPADRRRIAGLIDQACVEIGFFAVTGHGVAESVCRDLREAAHQFFALSPEAKRRASPTDDRTPRGYHAPGGEALAAANDAVAPPDLKEFYHVGPVPPSPTTVPCTSSSAFSCGSPPSASASTRRSSMTR